MLVSYELLEKEPVKERWARPGRIITDVDYIVNKKHFCSLSHIEKFYVSEISRSFKVTYGYGNKMSTVSSLALNKHSVRKVQMCC